MREELLALKVGQKKLGGEWMTLSKIADYYGKTFSETSAIVEELIQSGHLKPYGERIYSTQKNYESMIVERTSKPKTFRR